MADHPQALGIDEIEIDENLQRLLQIKQTDCRQTAAAKNGITEHKNLILFSRQCCSATARSVLPVFKPWMIGTDHHIPPGTKFRSIGHFRIARQSCGFRFSQVILAIVLVGCEDGREGVPCFFGDQHVRANPFTPAGRVLHRPPLTMLEGLLANYLWCNRLFWPLRK